MRPRRQYRLLQAAFIFALVGVAFWGSYVGYRASDYPSQAKADQQAQGIDYPSAVWHWLAHDAAGFFTAGLCVVTGLLAWFTYALYKTTSQLATETRTASAAALTASTTATNLARDEFNATHRPRIGVRSIYTVTIGEDGHLAFFYVNRGIGLARVTRIGCAIILEEFIRKAPAFEIQHKIPPVELRSGDSQSYEYTPHNVREFFFGRGYQSGADPRTTRSTAFFVGFVTYEDGAGRQRETGFCRKNPAGTDIWETVEGSGYEYED